MELAIIIATITGFFCHYLIERRLAANAVSVFAALLLTWLLLSFSGAGLVGVSWPGLMLTVAVVVLISILVGMVFAQHKKCSK